MFLKTVSSLRGHQHLERSSKWLERPGPPTVVTMSCRPLALGYFPREWRATANPSQGLPLLMDDPTGQPLSPKNLSHACFQVRSTPQTQQGFLTEGTGAHLLSAHLPIWAPRSLRAFAHGLLYTKGKSATTNRTEERRRKMGKKIQCKETSYAIEYNFKKLFQSSHHCKWWNNLWQKLPLWKKSSVLQQQF